MLDFLFSKNKQLLRASRKGDGESVLRLLQSGANPNARNSSQESALFLAAKRGHASVVDTLIQYGADVNSKNDVNNITPLIMASACGFNSIVRLLLSKGAEPNARLTAPFGLGASALMSAAVAGDHIIVEMLLDAGADPTITVKGKTSLSIAQEKGHIEVIDILQSRMK